MITCKDNSGVCDISEENKCCVNCSRFRSCKEKGVTCPTMRYQTTEELIIKNCIFSHKEKPKESCKECKELKYYDWYFCDKKYEKTGEAFINNIEEDKCDNFEKRNHKFWTYEGAEF